MDDMADLNDEIGDINEVPTVLLAHLGWSQAISTSYAVPDGFDEASFEAEPGAEDRSSLPPILRFNALEEEMKMEALAGISSASAKPSYLPEAILHGLADCRLYLCFASLNSSA